MQKNALIALVAILIVIVIVVVAVLLMGGNKTTTGTVGGTPGGTPGTLPGGTPGTLPGGIPGTLPGGTPGALPGGAGGSDVASAMAAGAPVVCTMTMDLGVVSGEPSAQGMTMTANFKMEYPKMKAEGSAMGMTYTIITDGTTTYLNMPMIYGNDWYMVSQEVTGDMGLPDANELRQQLANLPAGMTMTCQVTGDIADSEFMLPAGVVAKDLSEASSAYGGGSLGYY